jgi:hydroxymethylpyrimidine pyrophosphatase-like HAD family hydrolase
MTFKTYAFDIDGVICNTKNGNYKESIPNSRAIEKINSLHAKGHNIIIFTARFMGRTNNNYRKAYELGYELTHNQLCEWNLKFDKLILGKPSFDLLIDDKAFNYSEKWLEEL